MMKRIDQLPVVLTSFAYREEYFPELDGMIATVRDHHPSWHLITGKGPVSGFGNPTLEVESSAGKSHWSLPVSFRLDGTENDWHRIVFMKGWWMAEVWHHSAAMASGQCNRIVWLDADG